jgi:hypothetical protein
MINKKKHEITAEIAAKIPQKYKKVGARIMIKRIRAPIV